MTPKFCTKARKKPPRSLKLKVKGLVMRHPRSFFSTNPFLQKKINDWISGSNLKRFVRHRCSVYSQSTEEQKFAHKGRPLSHAALFTRYIGRVRHTITALTEKPALVYSVDTLYRHQTLLYVLQEG